MNATPRCRPCPSSAAPGPWGARHRCRSTTRASASRVVRARNVSPSGRASGFHVPPEGTTSAVFARPRGPRTPAAGRTAPVRTGSARSSSPTGGTPGHRCGARGATSRSPPRPGRRTARRCCTDRTSSGAGRRTGRGSGPRAPGRGASMTGPRRPRSRTTSTTLPAVRRGQAYGSPLARTYAEPAGGPSSSCLPPGGSAHQPGLAGKPDAVAGIRTGTSRRFASSRV